MDFVVGDRVECTGHRATVRFIGEVPPTKGTWLGVEWDDPARGRHSGCHEGTHFFETEKPNAGSFIRTNKVCPRRSFAEALWERYHAGDEVADRALIAELKDEMNAPFLELVGLDKIGERQSQLHELQIAVLNQMCISSCEDDLSGICPNISELDLSDNLLNSWTQVASIAQQLPRLSSLNISGNKLPVPDCPRSLAPAFANLRHLVINNMGYTWKDVVHCSTMWPSVEGLEAPNNGISTLEFMDNDIFCHLKSLNLEGNPIDSWEEINKLGQLPNLRQLSLYGTGLRNIYVKEDSFPELCKLSLSNNRISQWSHISELDKLPKLIDLKICSNKGLGTDTYETFQQWIIARIARLQVLNGTIINREDRRGAELDYLKFHGAEYLHTGADRVQFHAMNPRYHYLVQKHGAPELGELDSKPATLKSTLIDLKLVRGLKCVPKRLPSTMEVRKLKALCHRLFCLGGNELILRSSSAKDPNFFVALDNDLRSLSFYSLESGDQVTVCDE